MFQRDFLDENTFLDIRYLILAARRKFADDDRRHASMISMVSRPID